MKRKWFRALCRRRGLIILLLLLQMAFGLYLITTCSRLSQTLDHILRIISVITVLYIVSTKDKGANKTAWVVLILVFPLFGGLFYLTFHFQSAARLFAADVEKTSANVFRIGNKIGGLDINGEHLQGELIQSFQERNPNACLTNQNSGLPETGNDVRCIGRRLHIANRNQCHNSSQHDTQTN